ncbi:MAG: hypothetical protein U9R32_10715, partial [Bacteroidota bacterium]|nr:hypothetical protein [Bacteroidota bacterium]
MKLTTVIITGFLLITFAACNNNNDTGNRSDSSAVETDSIAIITNKIQNDTANADFFHKRAKLYLSEKNYNNALSDVGKAI